MEVYETLIDLIKYNARPLNVREKTLARSIFGGSIDLDRVRIDKWSFWGCRRYKLAYVSGYIINSWGDMSEALLVHELVHVWQYQQLGLVYIPRALRAQYSVMGYNYGGIESLGKVVAGEGRLEDFNLEQQGDIVADYFRIQHGQKPRWSPNNARSQMLLEKLVKDTFKGSIG